MNAQLNYRRLWMALGWLGVAVVVFGSLMPHPPQWPVAGGDKLQHITAYAVMMGWFAQIHPRGRYIALAAALVALGIGLEFLQALTPYRSFDVSDMLADAIGVALGWGLGRLLGARVLAGIEALMRT